VQQLRRKPGRRLKIREFDAFELVIQPFKNAATQRSVVAAVSYPFQKCRKKQEPKKQILFLRPAKEELIAELMPKILNTQLYKAVLDARQRTWCPL
jgi:F-type H+-transporting ATPase subunit gamma